MEQASASGFSLTYVHILQLHSLGTDVSDSVCDKYCVIDDELFLAESLALWSFKNSEVDCFRSTLSSFGEGCSDRVASFRGDNEDFQLFNNVAWPLSTLNRLTALSIALGVFPSLSRERRLPCFKKTCSASAFVLSCFRTADSLSLAALADVFSSTIGEG